MFNTMALLIIPGKEQNNFDVLTGDQGLEVHTATYRPKIDQLLHAKSVKIWPVNMNATFEVWLVISSF